MISLNTRIFDLSCQGFFRAAGDFICPVKPGEVLGVTLDEDAEKTNIVGGASYDPAIIGQDMIEIRASSMPSTIVTADTLMLVLSRDNYESMVLRAEDIQPHTHNAIIPCNFNRDIYLMGTSIKRVRRSNGHESYHQAGPTLMNPVLDGRKKWFSTASGLVRI